MLSLHGKESTFDSFAFHLAEKIGCTVGDLDRMTCIEYEGWKAYFEAKGSFSNLRKGM